MTVEHDETLTHRVHQELRHLHISGNLRGFYYLAHAIELTVQNPFRVQFITKDLYPAIAKRYKVSPASVERAIRTAINACWTRDGREALDQMAHYHVTQCPRSAEFIDIVAAYIYRNK